MDNLRTNPLVLLVAIALLAGALLIAGCGSDDGNAGGETMANPDPAGKYCPGDPDGGDRIPADAFDANELVGLELADAEAEAAKHGCTVRVTFEDGLGVPATMDFRFDRINVFCENGKVGEIDNIG